MPQKIKSGLIKLIAASLVFAVLDVWMVTSLLGAFRTYDSANSRKEATLYGRTAPDDPARFQTWVDGLPAEIAGGHGLILGVDADYNFEPAASDETALAVWDANKDSEEFKQALESVYYFEPYQLETPIDTKEGVFNVWFLPIMNDTEDDIVGASFMLVPEGTGSEMLSLIRNLGIIAWILFTALLGVALLARDPITGYGVIALFLISLVFIAYPLFEAVRMSFISDGRFRLAIWADAFKPEQ
jgi:iron(III) transport system permease protein